MEYYEIMVKSHLNPKRILDFEELHLEHLENGCTLLRGQLKDQSQLYALITLLRDLGVELMQVTGGKIKNL